MDINLMVVTGRLTGDPVISQVGDASCASFTVASNSRQKDSEGKYLSVFYRVTAWRKLGELCAQLLHKGDPVTLSGDFSVRSYTDRNGAERTALQINAEKVDFSGARKTVAASGYSASDELPI